MKLKQIWITLLVCTTIVTTYCPTTYAIRDIQLPYNKELKIKDLNTGIKRGSFISTAIYAGYLFGISNIIKIGKLLYGQTDEVTDPHTQTQLENDIIYRSLFIAMYSLRTYIAFAMVKALWEEDTDDAFGHLLFYGATYAQFPN